MTLKSQPPRAKKASGTLWRKHHELQDALAVLEGRVAALEEVLRQAARQRADDDDWERRSRGAAGGKSEAPNPKSETNSKPQMPNS